MTLWMFYAVVAIGVFVETFVRCFQVRHWLVALRIAGSRYLVATFALFSTILCNILSIEYVLTRTRKSFAYERETRNISCIKVRYIDGFRSTGVK